MASPSSSLWRNLSHFVLCVLSGMHPLCGHLSVSGSPWRRDADGRVLALLFWGVLRAWDAGPSPGLAEASGVSLQPSFQGWEGGCEGAALLRCSENQAVRGANEQPALQGPMPKVTYLWALPSGALDLAACCPEQKLTSGTS